MRREVSGTTQHTRADPAQGGDEGWGQPSPVEQKPVQSPESHGARGGPAPNADPATTL